MFNKKRLIMMGVAASMILPTNLAYLSVVTPILAEGENIVVHLSQQSVGTDGTLTLSEGSYILDEDIKDITKSIIIKDSVTIDLNGHSLTSSAEDMFKVQNDDKITFEILGKTGSSIISQFSDLTNQNAIGTIIWIDRPNGKLIIGPDVTLKSSSTDTFVYGIALSRIDTTTQAHNWEVNITGASIEATGAIYVNGDIHANGPTVNLSNAILKGMNLTSDKTVTKEKSVGIYQAGESTFNIVNSSIESDTCGIETRGGSLNISGGSVKGGTGTATIRKRGSKENAGTITENAGIAVAQHSTKLPINVSLIGVNEVSGNVALLMADPYTGNTSNISTVVSNTTLKTTQANSYPVGYTSGAKEISLTLVNTQFQGSDNQVQKLAPKDEANKDYSLIPVTDSDPLNYVVIDSTTTSGTSTVTPTASIPVDSSELTEVLGNGSNFQSDSKNTLLSPDGQQAVANLIKTQIETDNTLNYTYEVKVDPAVIKKSDDEYLFNVELKAKLNVEKKEDSKIRLLIPLKADLEEPETMLMAETSALDNDYEANTFPFDVILNKVLNDNNKLDPKKIKEELENDSTVSDVIKAKVNDLSDFANVQVDFDKYYPVVNEQSLITFSPIAAPVYRPSSNGKPKPKPEQPAEEPVVATPTTMYRLYNKLTGEHLYTIDKNERDHLLTSDTWSDEGQGWIAPSVSDYPVYRLLNPNNGDHHYTTDKNEFDTLPTYGWIAEGVAFFSADKNNPENVILHRLYNPNAEGAGSHHYTADTNERDTLVAKGWTYEGLAWAGLPESK